MRQTNARKTWVNKNTYSLITIAPTETQKPDFWQCDSGLEAKVLVSLMKCLWKPCKLSLHPRLEIASFTHKEVLKGYAGINHWKPDFMIENGITKTIVEVKGRIFHPFPYQYALCRKRYPQIPIFLISTEKDIKTIMERIKVFLISNDTI